MVRRNWDEYEVAKLIDTYQRFKNLPRKERVNKAEGLSKQLRSYAINLNIEIDATYRNLAGIIMRLSNIEYLFTDGERGLSCHSKMDIKMFNIYKQDFAQFNNILKEANKQMEMYGFENDFINWINKQENINGDEAVVALKEVCDLLEEEHIAKCFRDTFNEVDVVSVYFKELLVNSVFKRQEKKQCVLMTKAMQLYMSYLKSGFGEEKSDLLDKDNSTKQNATSENYLSIYDNNEILKKLEVVLKEKFTNGFRPNFSIDKARLKMYYFEFFYQEIQCNDEDISELLSRVGTEREGRIFAKEDSARNELVIKIQNEIRNAFTNGASCIYIDVLFNKFQNQLAEELQVYNEQAMKEVLLNTCNNGYSLRYTYFYIEGVEPDTKSDVIREMKKSHTPLSYYELNNILWYVGLERIKGILVNTKSIVKVAESTYFYAPNLPINNNEIVAIKNIIQNELRHKTYISATYLMDIVMDKYPLIVINTEGMSNYGIRNALGYILNREFSFNGRIISNVGQKVSMSDVFEDFCKMHKNVSVDEIKAFADDMNTPVYWDNIYKEMIRITKNEFVRKDLVKFNIESVDNVLDILIIGDYLPLKQINLFLHFPAMNVKWNSFLLESYLYCNSHKFALLHTSFSASDCCGAVVRKESIIIDYKSLLMDVLSKEKINDKNTALQFLVDEGYQQRRSYSEIEDVLYMLKLEREKETRNEEI